ncbi:hypothetical protein DC522_03240 [Microvirga sp. KLBC 81]|nr:hypothetical protein DC522_03240 [Microvirga sp. KLBC 81]
MLFYAQRDMADLAYTLELAGYDGDPPAPIDEEGWPAPEEELADFRINSRRLRDTRGDLQRHLLEDLQSGKLRASGFTVTGNIDAGALSIAPELWRTLQADFAKSEATGPGGLVIFGIRVFQSGAEQEDPTAPRAFSRARAKQWYKDWITRCEQSGDTPSRDKDWEAAKKEVGEITREEVRALRRELAPPHWTSFGRRKKAL